MSGRQELRLGSRASATVIAPALTAALLFGVLAAAGHHDCHAAGDDACPICWYASIPSHLPDAASPPLPPTPVIQQRVPPAARSQPISQPLSAVTQRGPPISLL